MEKKVFISHSSRDRKIAEQICGMIEKHGIGCWIAPRDIPYGSEWAGEITKALKAASICIFLFSENSNKSKQVAKEIQIAIDNEVVIIPIRVDNVEMNDVLTYYLATMHWLFDYDEKTLLERVENVLSSPEPEQHKENVDTTLQEKISEYFSEGNTTTELPNNSGSDRIKKKISKKHIDKLIANLAEISTTDESVKSNAEQTNLRTNPSKSFSLVDNEDQVTIAFEVVPVLDERKKAFVKSYLEELNYTDEHLADGRTKKTFYIEYLRYYDIPICTKMVLFTFCKEERCLFINNAVFEDDKVILSKEPQVEFWGSGEGKTIPNCNYTIIGKTACIELDADSQSDIIIIDLDALEVVKRQKQFDSKKNIWKTTIKLSVEKPYFVAKTQSKETKANEITIALGYLHGLWGLPCNVFKAIDLLEAEGSATAKYVLAQVFKNDELLNDNEDYIFYLSQAADLGHIESMMRLSDEYIDGVNVEQNYCKAKELLEAIVINDSKNGTAWNNLGWLYKNGYGCQQDYFEACRNFKKSVECGTKKAYKHLAQIAILSNEGALAYPDGLYYLCCAKKLGINNIEEIFEQYSERLNDYQLQLELAQQRATELQFKEFESEKFVVEDTSEDLHLVGGFPKWS